MKLPSLFPLFLVLTSAYTGSSGGLLVRSSDYTVLEHYLELVAIAGCIRSDLQLALDSAKGDASGNSQNILANSTAYIEHQKDYISPSHTKAECRYFCHDYPQLDIRHVWIKPLDQLGTNWGYIGVDHKSQKVIAVFRGFMRYGAYKELDHQPVGLFIQEYSADKPICGDDCKVDKVAYDAYLQIWEELQWPMANIVTEFPDYSLLVAGHNLGGAVAQFVAITLKSLQLDPMLVTVGSPAIGSPGFVNWHDDYFKVSGPLALDDISEKGVYFPTSRRIIHVTSTDHRFHGIEHFGGELWPHDTHQFITSHHSFKHSGGRIGLKNDHMGWPTARYLDNIFIESYLEPTAQNSMMRDEQDAQQPYMYPNVWYGVPMWCAQNDFEEYDIDANYCLQANASPQCSIAQSYRGPWDMVPQLY